MRIQVPIAKPTRSETSSARRKERTSFILHLSACVAGRYAAGDEGEQPRAAPV
jgi:hypothetical protein